MATVKEPSKKAPWPPLRSNDKLHRYPKERRVGQEKESFATIAKEAGVGGADLVWYNFQTRDGGEINWYLANYLKCPEPPKGTPYYSFFGAPYDPKALTGVIFIPTYGEPVSDYTNRFGEKVVENYNKSRNKEPGGLCYEAAYARVKEAGKQVGVTIPDLYGGTDFGKLWGSLIDPSKGKFLDLPEEYRGKGAAGAMANEGLGTLVDMNGVWAGHLLPGAVIQTWRDAADFDRVRDNKKPNSYGHSFIFLHYVYSGSSVAGMVIADQGFQNGRKLVKGDYGFWVGANLTTGAPTSPTGCSGYRAGGRLVPAQ